MKACSEGFRAHSWAHLLLVSYLVQNPNIALDNGTPVVKENCVKKYVKVGKINKYFNHSSWHGTDKDILLAKGKI